MRDPERRTKDAVNYRPARRDKMCGTCACFHPEAGTCDLVEGEVQARMVCDRWQIMPGVYSRHLPPKPRPER